MSGTWMFTSLLPVSAVAAPPDPAGDYAMIVDVGSSSKVAFAGTTEVITRTLLRVRLAQEGGLWVQEQSVCDVKVLSDSRSKVVIPRAFVNSLPRQSYPVTLTPTEGGWTYRADPGPSVLGYDPALTGGKMPVGPKDPGVLDPDGDGHPGVTVLLEIPVFGSVQMYVVQRGHSRYQGTFQNGGFEGSVEVVSVDQRTLGASFPPFAANPEIRSLPDRSRFRMVPAPGTKTCADLRDRWDGGFGW